jgi:Protein of unknown function (DUF3105)
VERAILKAVLALCFFVSLMLSACSEEPDKPDRTQDDAPEETPMSVEQPGKPPEGVKTYDVGPAGQHTEGEVDYEQSPPAGGEHNPVWQNCGYYAEPVRDENAVHSLEHGAVWITYSPDLSEDEVERLRDIAENETYVLVSPYEGLPSPVVASAWGKQLSLESAEEPDLERFIGAYRQGPQTPEPGAVCTGGIGQPA